MALREFPESHDSRTPGRTAWPARLAWIPIPAFVAAIAILYAQDSPESNDSRYLMLALNLVFSALICLFVTYLVARSFLVRPTPGLLMFGCGVLLWGLAGVVGIVAGLIGRSDEAFFINALITIHNCTVLLSGVCQLAGAALLLRPTRSLAAPGLWLAAGYTAVVGAVGLLTVATAAGWLPPFFVQGQGGTPLRQFILGSAVLLFAVTAALLVLSRRRSGSGFTRWYAMALALVSVGLFGILLERVHGGALSWTGRSAQFLSGVYMLAAAICAVRESRVWGIPLEAALRKSEQRYQELFNSMSEGFALHEIITNEAGTPVDYRFLDINPAFERLTGLRRENVVGRRVLEVLPDNDPYWVEAYGKVALTGEPARLENFATPLDRWYEAFAYRPAPRQFAVVFTDITERKRAEQEVQRLLSAVQEEKERLSCLLNSIGDEVWFADTHRQFTLANPAAAREFRLGPTDGIDVEKLAANLEVYRADGSPRPVEEAPPLRALAGEVIRGEEEIIRTPGAGELRHRQVSAAPVRDSGGRIIGSVAVVRDITDHKRAEEALRRSQKTFFELVERSPFGIYIVDSRFCVAQMNANAQNGAFRNVRPVIGRDFNEAMRILWPENVAAGILAAFRHTLESGEAYYSSRFVNPRHDVEIVEAYEWELHRITLPDGQYGVICYYYDSTELRQTEAALREGEERLRLVLQASSTGTFEVDLTTGEGRWNATEYELLGLKPGDVLPGPEIFFRYVHPDDVGLLRARWEEALRIGALDAEFRIVRADGEVRWLAGKGEFVYEATRGHDGREDRGKALRFMGVNFDIHARKQAEEALRDSERRQREKAAELAALLEAVPTPVFIAQDPDCLHLSGNRAADELLRIPRGAEASLSASEDIKPRHFKALKDGRELRLDELPAQRAARGEHVRDFEFSLAFDDGVVRHELGYGTPLVDEQGRPRGAVHVLVDITERKRAEEALRQARDELEHRVLERTA
ncbi:MAG: PAS domain S-box protein [Planctomycetota bacterium]|nr:PAS domain S-box protein [Planctomycetota bacterium]